MPGKLKALDKCYVFLLSTLLIILGFVEEVKLEQNFKRMGKIRIAKESQVNRTAGVNPRM